MARLTDARPTGGNSDLNIPYLYQCVFFFLFLFDDERFVRGELVWNRMKLTERKVKSHSLFFSFWDRQLGSIRRAGCCGSAWVLFKVRKTDFRVLEINEAALPSASNCLLSRFLSCGPVEIDLGVVWLKRSSLGWADKVMTSRECFGRFVRCYI